MTTEELKIKVKLDTSELAHGVKQIKDTLQGTSSEFNGINKATQGAANSTKAVTAAMATMGAATVAQTAIMARSISKTGTMFIPLKKYIKLVKDDMRGLGAALTTEFDAVGDGKIKAFIGTLKTGLKEVGVSTKLVGKNIKDNLTIAVQNAKTSIKANMSAIKTTILSTIASITAFTAALIGLSSTTKEFRQAMNQINTSFIALGSNAETAQKAYEGFYRILGDVQRSTEAANLLAQITTGEKELYQWTKIATGALAMFPDSLPTESLIEATNETIKTAKVTGALADALNWPANSANKISKALEGSAEAQKIFNDSIKKGLTVEDAFNEVLAATNSETQREIILRASLNGVYGESAKLYEKMNKELIAQNEAQYRLNQATAKLGKITQPLHTAFTNLKAALANALAPAIKVACDWLIRFMNLLSKAIAWVGAFIAVIFPSAANAINDAFNGAGNALGGVADQTDGLTNGINGAAGAAKALKKTLMGFDELNVVSVMSNTESDAGAGATGGGLDVSGIDTGESVFKKAQEELDNMKEKVKAFLEEWKTEIGIIAAALGTLGLANIIGGLGKAIGLGEKFLGIIGTIKKLAATAIIIALQYSFVNEFMDNYIDGQGFKEYLKGLIVAAIGTGILYAMWGPTGLVIGLAVTAVASLKAVIDNGGITNIESAVVAFTGLAAAAGAVALAWKPMLTIFNGIKAVFGAIGGNQAAISALAFLPPAFTKIADAIVPVTTGMGAFVASLKGALGAIGAVFGATGTTAVAVGAAVIVAAIAAVVSVVVYLKNHWNEVTGAMKRFFDLNIAPKLEGIKDSFKKIGEALGPVGKAIGNVIKAIGDFLAKVKLLEAIEKIFDKLGGVIFNVIAGVIAGAISTAIGLVESLVKAFSGAVQIISGAVQAIVKLFTGDLQGALDAVKLIGDGIVAVFEGLWGLTVGAVKNFVQGVIDWFVALWDELVGHSIVPDTIEAIVKWFLSLPSKIFGELQKFVNGVIDKFENMKKGISDKMLAAKNTITGTWDSVKRWFNSSVAPKFTVAYWKNKFNTIKDGAKAAFNGVISVVEQAINGIIRKINTLSWTIPDWVPVFGGDQFGFNFKTISIPRLATGGIATRSTVANIGEAGREAVLPLDRNTEWMDQLADRIAARNQTPTRIVLKVGEKELGWASINGINQITRQTGELQLVL